jgi:hypothetical protein
VGVWCRAHRLDGVLVLPFGGEEVSGGDALGCVRVHGEPAMTRGLMRSMMSPGTSARLSSSTEAYGRLAMIFLAVSGPMPRSVCNSACVALLISTFAFAVVAPPTLPGGPSRFVGP